MSILHGIAAVDSDHIVAVRNHLVISIWRGETTGPAVRELNTIIQDAAKRAIRGVGLVQVVEASASLPDGAGRHELGVMLSASRNCVKSSAVIYEGDGLKAAAVRCTVTTLTLVAKPPFPHKIFGDLQEAAIWHVLQLPPELKATVAASEYATMIASLRDQIPGPDSHDKCRSALLLTLESTARRCSRAIASCRRG